MNALKPQVLLKPKVSPSVVERRRSRRRQINRVAKIQFGSGSIYRVVWRLGYEIGAKFVGHVRRTGVSATG
jgi:hypothetical protein